MKAFALAALLIAACGGAQHPHNSDGEGCEAACANLRELKFCGEHEGSPGPDDEYDTDDDVPCAPTCQDIEGAGPGFGLNTQCLAKATNCKAVAACDEAAQ
jgi:hypothetical protein